MVALDSSFEKVISYKNLNVHLICCDIINTPFRKAVAYLIVFHFTLHEVNPSLYERILKIACEIPRNIMIVEPSPEGCLAYKLYSNIWRETMHSIVKFEDYKTLAYWKKLVKKSGFRILLLS